MPKEKILTFEQVCNLNRNITNKIMIHNAGLAPYVSGINLNAGTNNAEKLPQTEAEIRQAFDALNSAMLGANYDAGRESFGSALVCIMLGQKDSNGNPLYTMDQVLDENQLIEEKKALGKRFFEEITNQTAANYAENLRKNDIAMLEGWKQIAAELRVDEKKFREEGNLSYLADPKVQTLRGIDIIMRTNHLSSDKTKFLARINQAPANGKSVAEELFGSAENLEKAKQPDYEGFTMLMGQYNEFTKNFLGQYDETVSIRKSGSGLLLKPLIMQKTLQISSNEHPGEPISFESIKLGESAATDPTNTDFYMDAEEYFKEGKKVAGWKKHPEYRLMEYFQRLETDPLYEFGAAQLALSGKLIKQYDYTMNEDETQLESLNFETASDREVYGAALLLDNTIADPALYEKMKHLGVRKPARTTGFDSSEADAERTTELTQLAKDIKSLQSFFGGHSDQWVGMRAALEKVNALCSGRSGQPLDEHQLEEMNAAMELLQTSAQAYMEHKLDVNQFKAGKDEQRVWLAKRLSNFANRELEQSRQLVAEKYLDREAQEAAMARGGANTVKEQHQARDTAYIGNILTELDKIPAHGVSDQFQSLQNSLKAFQKDGQPENLQPMLEAANRYLEHKQTSNNGGVNSINRMMEVTKLKLYLENSIQNWQNPPKPTQPKVEEPAKAQPVLEGVEGVFAQKLKAAQQELSKISQEGVKPENREACLDAAYTVYAVNRYRLYQRQLSLPNLNGNLKAELEKTVQYINENPESLVEQCKSEPAVKNVMENLDMTEYAGKLAANKGLSNIDKAVAGETVRLNHLKEQAGRSLNPDLQRAAGKQQPTHQAKVF